MLNDQRRRSRSNVVSRMSAINSITIDGTDTLLDRPMFILIEEYEGNDEVVARIPELQAEGFGATEIQAINELKAFVGELYQDLASTPNENLGRLLLQSKLILQGVAGQIDDIPDAALVAIHTAPKDAAEEGFPTPSAAALQNAKRILLEIRRISNLDIDVYPGPDGEIALDIAPPPPMNSRSVILLCESDGSAFCSLNIDGINRNKRYASTETIPDDFLIEVLSDLENRRG